MKFYPIGIIILLLFFATFMGCKKFDKKTQFNLEVNESFTIPSVIGVSVPFVNVPTPSVNTNIDEELRIRDRKKKKIESILLKTLQLSITSPLYSDFSFLNDVDIYISADELPQILVAQEHDIPFSIGSVLNLTPIENVELEEYIKKDVINIHVEITTDETILQDVDVDLFADFFVDVKVFGI